MSGELVLDSYALIAYFENEPGAKKIQRLIIKAEGNKRFLLLSVVNWGEIYYMTRRERERKRRKKPYFKKLEREVEVDWLEPQI